MTDLSLGVVITGGSAGLGFALASAFLAAGDRVVICGRNHERLDGALHSLSEGFPEGEVYAIRSDDILETITTNLSGSILLCAEAVRLMESQPSSPEAIYHIFNMGFSFSGAAFSRSAVPHKASKRGVAELTHFLSKELRGAGKTSIGVHELSPGLVLTGLLLQDASPEAMRLFRVIAERPEHVATRLAPKIRSITGSHRHIRYQPFVMTLLKALTGIFRTSGKR